MAVSREVFYSAVVAACGDDVKEDVAVASQMSWLRQVEVSQLIESKFGSSGIGQMVANGATFADLHKSVVRQSITPDEKSRAPMVLRPILPSDTEQLLVIVDKAGRRGTLRHRLKHNVSLATLAHLIGDSVSFQRVLATSTGAVSGLLSVYSLDEMGRTAYFQALIVDRADVLAIWEGVFAFVRMTASVLPLRKLYMELPAGAFAAISSGVEVYFELEGRFAEHEYIDGRLSSVHTLAIYLPIEPAPLFGRYRPPKVC